MFNPDKYMQQEKFYDSVFLVEKVGGGKFATTNQKLYNEIIEQAKKDKENEYKITIFQRGMYEDEFIINKKEETNMRLHSTVYVLCWSNDTTRPTPIIAAISRDMITVSEIFDTVSELKESVSDFELSIICYENGIPVAVEEIGKCRGYMYVSANNNK